MCASGPQTLAPATQEQALAQGPLPHMGEDEDDVMAEAHASDSDEQPDQQAPPLQDDQVRCGVTLLQPCPQNNKFIV